MSNTDGQRDSWFDVGAWQRGSEVESRGALFDLRREKLTYRARCHGTEGGLYHLSLTLGPNGNVAVAHCTCAVGAEGRCKHVAALRRRLERAPGDFIEVAPLGKTLRSRTRAELIELVGQMLARHPELETLVHLPMPGGKGAAPVQAAAIEREADAVFDEHGAEYGAEVPIVDQLAALAGMAQRFADAGDVANCLGVSRGLSQSIYKHLPLYTKHEHADDLRSLVLRCVHALGSCLHRDDVEASLRASVVGFLREARAADLKVSDVGPAEAIDSVLLTATTAEERSALATAIREGLPESQRREVERLAWEEVDDGELLFSLEAETLSDEAFLAGARRLGRSAEAVARLLDRGRTREAFETAREARSGVLVDVADTLAARGQGEFAEQLLLSRSEQDRAPALLLWVFGRAVARGEAELARTLAETLVEIRPDHEAFLRLRSVVPSAEWGAARERALGAMEAHGYGRELVFSLLEEDLIERAIDYVRTKPTTSEVALKVAERALLTHPIAGSELLKQQVEVKIAEKSRASYQEAAALVARVVNTLRGHLRFEEAKRYPADLRKRYPRLRALHEELANASL